MNALSEGDLYFLVSMLISQLWLMKFYASGDKGDIINSLVWFAAAVFFYFFR